MNLAASPRPVRAAAPREPARVLHPGDVAVAGRGERLETLLGSCVAVVLADPRRTVGAMCHVVHALPAPAGRASGGAHGDTALALMFARLRGLGIEPRLCEAWVYGGGHMFPRLLAARPDDAHVGSHNVQWALAALAAHGIRVLDRCVGGNAYRRLGWTVGTEPPEVVAVPVDG
jgi:chemotaxis protein CheD